MANGYNGSNGEEDQTGAAVLLLGGAAVALGAFLLLGGKGPPPPPPPPGPSPLPPRRLFAAPGRGVCVSTDAGACRPIPTPVEANRCGYNPMAVGALSAADWDRFTAGQAPIAPAIGNCDCPPAPKDTSGQAGGTYLCFGLNWDGASYNQTPAGRMLAGNGIRCGGGSEHVGTYIGVETGRAYVVSYGGYKHRIAGDVNGQMAWGCCQYDYLSQRYVGQGWLDAIPDGPPVTCPGGCTSCPDANGTCRHGPLQGAGFWRC